MMTCPKWLKGNARARAIFRKVVKHLAESGGGENVDAEQVAIYAHATAKYEELSEWLDTHGSLVTNDKGVLQRHPRAILAARFFQTMKDQAKALGIDRANRLKGKEKRGTLGKTTDKLGRLRKIG